VDADKRRASGWGFVGNQEIRRDPIMEFRSETHMIPEDPFRFGNLFHLRFKVLNSPGEFAKKFDPFLL
jgi:hypothetical protein